MCLFSASVIRKVISSEKCGKDAKIQNNQMGRQTED